jgi:hypothetical protein
MTRVAASNVHDSARKRVGFDEREREREAFFRGEDIGFLGTDSIGEWVNGRVGQWGTAAWSRTARRQQDHSKKEAPGRCPASQSGVRHEPHEAVQGRKGEAVTGMFRATSEERCPGKQVC